MKRNFIVTMIALLTMALIPNFAQAEISVKDYMSYDFLEKQGYSPATLRLIEINKAKTFGEEIPSVWPENKWLRAYRKFMAYIDPADDYGDFGTHKIYMRSTPWDY